MAWTAPSTWTFDQFVDEDDFNAQIRDNMLNLHFQYATSLPGSPADGETAVLVDSLTAPTYHWQLRYNASNSTSYKWEFLGGVPQRSAQATISQANQTSYVMTSSPAAILAPRAGVYDIIITGTSQRQTVFNGLTAYWSYNINSAGAADSNASTMSVADAGALYFIRSGITLAASDSLRIAYRMSNTGVTQHLDNAQLSLQPVRLS